MIPDSFIKLIGRPLRLISYTTSRTRIRFYKNFALIIFSSILEALTVISVTFLIDLFQNYDTNNQILEHGGNHLIKIINNLFLNSQINGIIIFTFFIIFSGIVRIYALWFNGVSAATAGTDIVNRVFSKILYWPYLKHLENNSTVTVAAITQFGKSAVGSLRAFIYLWTSLFIAISVSLTLLLVNLKSSITVIFILSICYLLNSFISRKQLGITSKIAKQEKINILNIIQNSLGSIKNIILSYSQRESLDLFIKSDNTLRKANAKAKFISMYPKYLFEVIGVLAILFLIFEQRISLSEIAILLLGSQKLLPAIQMIHINLTTLKQESVQVDYIIDILEENIKSSKKLLYNVDKEINYNDLFLMNSIFFSYRNDSDFILNNFSMSFNKGDFALLTGPSGSGKTTILDIAMGLLFPEKGEISFGNKKLLHNGNIYDLYSWRKSIAHVSQRIFIKDSTLAENISIKSHLELSENDIDNIYNICKICCLDELINSRQDGIYQSVGENGCLLSGGQIQRLSIARALFQNASLLILDESTSALDLKTEEKLLENIKDMKGNCTILMVSHRKETSSFCDKIINIG